MRTPTLSRLYVASIIGLSGVVLAFACDGTETAPTPTPTPDLAMAVDMAMNVAMPVISSITPALGSTQGGTAVTIKGTGFEQGATIKLADGHGRHRLCRWHHHHVFDPSEPGQAGTV